jgi:hypothetical protein
LYQDEDTIWARILHAKYQDVDSILIGSGQGGSQFWKGLHKIKQFFAMGAKFLLRDGRRTRLWVYQWCGDSLLKDRFSLIFAICDDTEVTVAQVLSRAEVNVRLRRSLDHVGRVQWQQLCDVVANVQLSHSKDKVVGPWNRRGSTR